MIFEHKDLRTHVKAIEWPQGPHNSFVRQSCERKACGPIDVIKFVAKHSLRHPCICTEKHLNVPETWPLVFMLFISDEYQMTFETDTLLMEWMFRILQLLLQSIAKKMNANCLKFELYMQ